MASSFNKNVGKNDLPPEPDSNYYEDRKKIIFKKLTISKNEDYLLSIIKKSQLVVCEKKKQYNKNNTNSFFTATPKNVYDLSVYLKENIANYCLILSLYLNEKKNLDALRLFLQMCELNKQTMDYLIFKIKEQIPKISNRNRIALFYPTITKTMLQILSLFIKLSGKFNKSKLENFFIEQYLNIVHILSITGVKYINSGKTEDMGNQFKNERNYYYSHCLFDCSIYLFNRFQPLCISIYILQHIIERYNNNPSVNSSIVENESTLLLKTNYNLALFYYTDGYNIEAINNLNQAKERLSDIRYFPVSEKCKSRISLNEEDLRMNKLRSNNNDSSTSTFILDFNDVIAPANHISRNKYKRNSIKSGTHIYNDKDSLEQQSSLYMKISNDTIHANNKHVKEFSTIYLGAYNMLKFKHPIELDIVKDKIAFEIELLFAEIELKNKNYKESLNHINYILNLQKKFFIENGISNKDNIRLTKNTLNSQTETEANEKKYNDKSKFISNFKKNLNENNSLFISTRDKSQKDNLNASNNNLTNNTNSQIIKYHLTNGDKSRILRLLEEIEISSLENEHLISKNKNLYDEETKTAVVLNKNLIRNQKNRASKEMEKFFIFLCGLSIYQLKILNDTQPPPSRRRNDLPIIFNNQFQDCLTNSQRMALALLETMSLSRYILLKDSNKDISMDNLDYRFMLYKIKDKQNNDRKNIIMHYSRNKFNAYRFMKSAKGFNMRCNTLHIKGTKKVTKKIETEEEDSQIKYFMRNNHSANKKLIFSHKKGVIKLLDQMNKDEQKMFYKNPELLTKIIENSEKIRKK